MQDLRLPLGISTDGNFLYEDDVKNTKELLSSSPDLDDKRKIVEARWRKGEWTDLWVGGSVVKMEQAIAELKSGTPLGKNLLEIGWTACTFHRERLVRTAARPPLPLKKGERFPLPVIRSPAHKATRNNLCTVTMHNTYSHPVYFLGKEEIPANGSKKVDVYENEEYWVWDVSQSAFVAWFIVLPGVKDFYINKDALDFPPGAKPEYSDLIMCEINNHLNTAVQIFSRTYEGELALEASLYPNQGITYSPGSAHNVSFAAITNDGKLVSQRYCSPSPDTKKFVWDIYPESLNSYGVKITPNNYLYAPWISAYSLEKSDFTALVTVASNSSGALIASKEHPGGPMCGGFILALETDNRIRLTTDDGIGYYEAVSKPVPKLGNYMKHCIAGVRKNGQLLIYCDGKEVDIDIRSTRIPPLNISNKSRITIGYTDQVDPCKTLTGNIYNAGLWKRALTGKEQLAASFEIDAEMPVDALLGYWDLDYRLDDRSSSGNALHVQGNVPYLSDFDTEWVYGEHKFMHICCKNPQNDLLSANVEIQRTLYFTIEAGTPSVALSVRNSIALELISADNVAVKLLSPSGVVYGKDSENCDTGALFLQKNTYGLESFVQSYPEAGEWAVEIRSKIRTPFKLTIQTMPDCDADSVQDVIIRAMSDLYGNEDDTLLAVRAFQNSFMLLNHVEVEEKSNADGVWPFVVVRGFTIAKMLIGPILANPVTWVAAAALVLAVGGYFYYRNRPSLAKRIPAGMLLMHSAMKAAWDPQKLVNTAKYQALCNLVTAKFQSVVAVTSGTSMERDVQKALNDTNIKFVSMMSPGGMGEIFGSSKLDRVLSETTTVNGAKIFFLYADYSASPILGIGQQLVKDQKAKAVFGFENMVMLPANDYLPRFAAAIFRAEEAMLDHQYAENALKIADSEFGKQVADLKKNSKDFLAALMEYLRTYFKGPSAQDKSLGDPTVRL